MSAASPGRSSVTGAAHPALLEDPIEARAPETPLYRKARLPSLSLQDLQSEAFLPWVCGEHPSFSHSRPLGTQGNFTQTLGTIRLGGAGAGTWPLAGNGSRPEGDLSPDAPCLPASATPWKLKKKDALGAAHVLNETQIFFLAMVHFSQLRLS